MEPSNLIAVAVVLAIIIVPILIVSASTNKKKRKLTQLAGQLEAQYQLKFTIVDKWDNRIIGLDTGAGRIVWHNMNEPGNTGHCIDLREIKQCKTVKDMRTVAYKGESSQALDRLALELIPKDGNSSPYALVFYDVNSQFIINTQGQMLDKWYKLLSSQLGKAS